MGTQGGNDEQIIQNVVKKEAKKCASIIQIDAQKYTFKRKIT